MDADTERFYAFEREARRRYEPDNPVDLSIDELAEIGELALAAFGVNRFVMFADRHPFGRLAGSTSAFQSQDTDGSVGLVYVIGLPRGRRRPWCVLHETAHVIAHVLSGVDSGHGGAFPKTCLALWRDFGGWPNNELVELALAHGVVITACEICGLPTNLPIVRCSAHLQRAEPWTD